MSRTNTKGNSRALFLIGVVGVILLAVFLILLLNVRENGETPSQQTDENPPVEETPEEIAWVTYTNDEYGFSLEHPSDWTVAEYPDDSLSPKFNIYVPETVASGDLPLTHHSENASHVSIFPQGVPTEGFFGEAEDTSVDFAVPTEEARDFTLEDGTAFATIAFMPEGGRNWEPWGFVFAHATVEGTEITCLRDGFELDPSICDPLFGDTMIRDGNIDTEVRAAQVRMLESFRFLE